MTSYRRGNNDNENDILLERSFVIPKPVENYMTVIADLYQLVCYIKQDFQVSTLPEDIKEKFKLENIQELKSRLVKSYLLLTDFLKATSIALKSLITEYNDIYRRIPEFKEQQEKVVQEQKEQIKQAILKLDQSGKNIKSIDSALRGLSNTRDLTLTEKELVELFESDTEFIEHMKNTLPERTFRQTKENYTFNLKMDYSISFLVNMNAVLQSQIEAIKSSIDINKSTWIKLSEKIQVLAKQLEEAEQNEG